MKEELGKKYASLRKIIGNCQSAAVAYSGGVDSSLLLSVSHEVLGQNCIALYVDSDLQPAREKQSALRFASQTGIRLIVLEGVDLSHDAFRKHPENRCYLCKGLIFDRIMDKARQEGIDIVFDGSNHDDLSDHRPGKRALKERNIRSPLQEAGLTKADIRELSKTLGLPTWDKDALACLATRIPFHEEVTRQKLRLIDRVESMLVERGYRNVRARLHKETISIEVRKDQIPRLTEEIDSLKMEEIPENTDRKKIIIDPDGYQQGKMNRK